MPQGEYLQYGGQAIIEGDGTIDGNDLLRFGNNFARSI